MMDKPVLGILLGDATGIGPELVAKLAARDFYEEYCYPVIIGDIRVFEEGLRVIGRDTSHYPISHIKQADWGKGVPVFDTHDQDPARIVMKKMDPYCGAGVNNMIALACRLCTEGQIEGFSFAPFHKAAMKEAGCKFESEHHLMANIFGVTRPFGEINMLENVMTVRTTSHIPLKDVSSHLTVERISRAIDLGYHTARSLGLESPRVGVAAFNPHCGEEGRCGREEIDAIAPAIEWARERGWNVTGPLSSDIVFMRAFKGEFDAVVTMYHDQGQIALKLKGFDQGITVAGGMPYPIVTCAHGTAYGKAGEGRANTSAFENAVKMTARMAMAARAMKDEEVQ